MTTDQATKTLPAVSVTKHISLPSIPSPPPFYMTSLSIIPHETRFYPNRNPNLHGSYGRFDHRFDQRLCHSFGNPARVLFHLGRRNRRSLSLIPPDLRYSSGRKYYYTSHRRPNHCVSNFKYPFIFGFRRRSLYRRHRPPE